MDEKQIVKNIKKFRTSKKMSLDRLAKIGNPPVYPLKLLAFWTGFPRNALQYSYYVRYRISGWKTQKYMDVIRSYSHLLNLKPMTLSYLPKHLFNSITYIFSLNPFSIFGRPDQMVTWHRRPHVPSFGLPCDSYIIFHLPLADTPFIPAHRTGFSGVVLMNQDDTNRVLIELCREKRQKPRGGQS